MADSHSADPDSNSGRSMTFFQNTPVGAGVFCVFYSRFLGDHDACAPIVSG